MNKIEFTLAALLLSFAVGVWACGEAADTAVPATYDDATPAPVDGDELISDNDDEDLDDPAIPDETPPLPALDPSRCADSPPIDFGDIDLGYESLHSDSTLLDKNWYLLTVLMKDKATALAIKNDARARALSAARDQRWRDAVESCGPNVSCLVDSVLWTDADVTAAAKILYDLFADDDRMADPVNDHLRPSGRFELLADDDDAHVLVTAWRETVRTMSNIVLAASGNMTAVDFEIFMREASEEHPELTKFYEPLAWSALGALFAQDRDEAVRYEPMDHGINAPAIARMSKIDWAAYRFIAIVVPGYGPTTLDRPLSPLGGFRCDLAAARYKAGVAPFIVTSGGHVHPEMTPYSEAIEMKKYLMDVHGIPENAILVDPHARHTTTNLRNASRLLLRYGAPATGTALITTDVAQNTYISYLLGGRCLEELGYLPWRRVRQLSMTDSCMTMNPESLHVAPSDALDP